MKKLLFLTLCVAVLISGCASSGSNLNSRVDVLEKRMDRVEEDQTSIEEHFKSKGESITYVSTAQTSKEVSGKVSLSKRETQIALMNAGYYDGPVDGKLGKQSRKAIMAFQEDKDLKVDGIAGSQTQKALLKYLDN
ncbi:MAG: peptidoglycan-binding domain-containing protein [Candidatus Tantalella remota]|nr:peptidoglycan-binding domain-containing protein [Candidatus Tantalella remota]